MTERYSPVYAFPEANLRAVNMETKTTARQATSASPCQKTEI